MRIEGSLDLDSLGRYAEKKLHPGVSKEKVSYELPRDVYKPAMFTSPEHIRDGSRVLKDGWKMLPAETMPAADDPRWKAVEMPSQWAVDSPDLFSYGGNVWYMKKFVVKPEEMAPEKHLALTFRGVDYKAEVFLNGQSLGGHEGYFEPFSFPLDGKIRPDTENTMMVRVSAPRDPGTMLFKDQIKGIFNQHDCRPGGFLASGGTIGTTGGIWNDVILESTGLETIKNQCVETRLSEDHTKATLAFNYQLESLDSNPREVTVRIRYAPADEKDPEKCRILTHKVTLQPGLQQLSIEAQEENPLLWWTHDHGKPNLYRMETEILDGNKVSDSLKGHFGIRELDYNEKTGILKLNDMPVYQKGTNYIPTQWLSTYTEEKYENDLHRMKEAHLNAVRVHAHILPQEFYDAADREGMLVWADFPLIWGTNPSLSFMAKAREQYRSFIESYRNHPSIWVWSGHNEPLPYDFLLDYRMDQDASRLDPSRYHKRGSGFTEHFYPGWYSPPYGKAYTDIDKYKPKLPSEFGAQAIGASMKDIIGEKEQWPISEHEDKWRFHDFQTKENYKYIGKPELFSDLDEYIDISQKYQYDYNKYVTEYFRRLKYKPTGGFYQFMFKESWPSVTWAVEDYKNTPKMAYYALKDALNPTLVSIEWKKTAFKPGETVKTPLWLINDHYADLKGTKLCWKIYEKDDKNKKPLMEGRLDCDVPRDSAQAMKTLEFTIPGDAGPGRKWILDVAWNGPKGETLSKNLYMFRTEGPSKGDYKYEPVYPEYPAVA